jgi:ABC-2 type transport system ATP-binding protein
MIPAIDVHDVHKRYGAFEALRGVSLAIEQGEFFGLLGPNGAGKTSLISIVAGLNHASQGTVHVMGHDVVTDYRAARQSLGVVPQELVFDPFFSVRETLRLTSGYYGIRRNDDWIDEILSSLDLTSKADANMRSLSGGMKRRVLVAQALVHRPPVIVLDEPTAGVDVELRQALWQFIRRLNRAGHTIVLTTHYLEEAQELCGRIAMLKHGRVVALDRTSRLLGRFGGGGTLSLKVSGAPLPPELAARAAAGAGAESESESESQSAGDGRLRLAVDRYEDVEPVLASLRLAGCRIDEMELVQTDLEDVFVKTMQGSPA